MSTSDLWHSPLIEATIAGPKNPLRVDLQDSASSEEVKPVEASSLVRAIEGASSSGFKDKKNFLDHGTDTIQIVEYNFGGAGQD